MLFRSTTYSANGVVLGGTGTGTWSSSNTAVATVNASGVVTGVAAGSATITYSITGGCGGTVSANQSITIHPNNTISLTSANGTDNQTICVTNSVTAITYSTTGATGASINGLPTGITGSWSNNVVTISGISSQTGSFTYTVTLSGGCGSTSTTGTITITPALSVTGTVTNVNCNGASTGAINLSVTGGNTPYTYVWSNGATTQNITGLNSGVYTVTVSCGSGCLATTTFTVTQPSALSATTTQVNVLCFGNATGSVDLTVSGGTAPYT